MKRYILSFLAITSCLVLVAQPKIHFGVTTAMNSTLVLNQGLESDPRYGETEFTYQWSPIGFSFGTDFTRGFGLQLEAMLNNQEQIRQIQSVVNTVQKVKAGEQQLSMQYLQLPLLMRFMSKGGSATRFNFNIGPQLSLLTDAQELATLQPGDYEWPDGEQPDPENFPDATQNPDGTWNLPSGGTDVVISETNDFRNAMFTIAGGFGLDIDVSKNIYLTTYTRFTYAFQDVRNEDFFNSVVNGNYNQLLKSSAIVDISVQLGVHYMIGGTRSFF